MNTQKPHALPLPQCGHRLCAPYQCRFDSADEYQWLERTADAARGVLADMEPVVIDRSLLALLKRCRVHVAVRAIDGRGDSRDVLRWLDEEIEKLTQEIRA